MDGLDATRPPPPALHRDHALFLDIDGSLVEFASRPESIVVPAALRSTLSRLSEWLDGALALVSGREVHTIDTLFAPLRLPVAALHGHALRTADGVLRQTTPIAAMPAVVADAATLCRQHAGALVEDKGVSIALHWRNTPAAEIPLRAFAEAALARLPGYRLQPGHCVIELVPACADKGSAIAALLEEPPFHGRRPVFVGDDLTDEPGFRTVNARGGISVLVGVRADSAARHALPDPASVRDWLGSLTHGESA
ncbi:trehalose-phosphatase [Lysobacter brunescens]|uniref:Trehalose 6-phosphate phosphatase n=1 Tax=Lysobacter brunescens TaxID=262323 RepID=A0ABW2YDF8_9GAMM